MSENTEAGGLVERLRDRAESYRMGGPSSEHTAAILDEAATALASERAAHEQTRRLLADVRDDAMRADNEMCAMEANYEARLAEALKALVVAQANLNDIEFLTVDGFLEWQAARRVREGGKVDG